MLPLIARPSLVTPRRRRPCAAKTGGIIPCANLAEAGKDERWLCIAHRSQFRRGYKIQMNDGTSITKGDTK